MPSPHVRVAADSAALTERFETIRRDLGLPDHFPSQVEEEARKVVAEPLARPDRDETAIPFCTIDPVGSMDLDQALHIEREGEGYRVRYAITYLPAYIAAGGAIDTEARQRGQTIYSPDVRTPLHPKVLSEGAASLLPNQVTAAYIWDMHLAADGEGKTVEVYRALVRSVDRFDYDHVQQVVDAGTNDERLSLLKEVGEKRIAFEGRRGGASLPMPEQEVHLVDGEFELEFRPPLPAEEWNAQISLMTGMAAAGLMLDAGVGLLRTMPPATPEALSRFRRQASALGVPWRKDLAYGAFLRGLDRTNPRHLALIYEAASLFRGAGYRAFDGQKPDQTEHSAIAAPYAHVTAPLRRLVDRFGLAICEAISSGSPIPDWARSALPGLPEIMSSTGRLASQVERACTDAVEAAILSHHVGQTFDAVLVDRTDRGGTVQLLDPAVVATAQGPGTVGDPVRVKLTKADLATGQVAFQIQESTGDASAAATI